MFVFSIVKYYITTIAINDNYTWYSIYSAWILDRILTCLNYNEIYDNVWILKIYACVVATYVPFTRSLTSLLTVIATI